jgi:UDP-N-acetyl-D-galactosamine dehydrogenase
MKSLESSLLPEIPVVGVIGLGYVGLPLAAEFSSHVKTIGFDVNKVRVSELLDGIDRTGELSPADIGGCANLILSSDSRSLKECNVFIVTVPTPIDSSKKPDLSFIRDASELVGEYLDVGNVVIYESTVYPGVTDDYCVPILEEVSSLKLNEGFYIGYSPERINPGDKQRSLSSIVKITSGSTEEAALYIDGLYLKIIKAGTHRASSIRVAEAAKVIENVQRDLNIGLVNELALIFDKLGIDTLDVLEAAGTKWNFLPFRPGLVGGHCISVDPYYLTHKASESGYHPDVILAGRRINDCMGAFIADKLVKLMVKSAINVSSARVLILGAAFKEDCPDLRNTKVIDIVNQLKTWGLKIDLCDPIADEVELRCCNIDVDNILNDLPVKRYEAVVLAVAHKKFVQLSYEQLQALCSDSAVIYDVKSAWPKDWVTDRL